MHRTVFMAGAFPPPVHGMAFVNNSVSQMLLARGTGIVVANLAAPSLARGPKYHALRMARTLRGLGQLFACKSAATSGVYMSISGGLGQAYEVPFVLLARLKRLHVTLHHHSYAYLSRPSALARLLFAAAPPDTRHVALSSGMADELRRVYGISNTLTLSNAAFMPTATAQALPDRPLATLGFLSNISAEKGIYDFIALMDACVDAGLPVNGVIAGPFQDGDTESQVMPLIRVRPALRYVGPQYGEAKTAFFRGIDVLAFPTRYANEAEPVTIHEALLHGVPVIAYARGAIPEILDGGHGAVIPCDAEFAPQALQAVADWRKQGAAFSGIRRLARERSLALRERASRSLLALLDSL